MRNQDPEKGIISPFAPTVSREIIMMTITMIISSGWKMHSRDVEKAFLQSKRLRREVYIQSPGELATDSDVVWRLRKAAYGFGEAGLVSQISGKEWYTTLWKFLREKNDQLKRIMALHADNFLFENDVDLTWPEDVVIPRLSGRRSRRVGTAEN